MNSHKSPFSNQVRIRSCGLLVERDAILLVQLRSPVTGKLIWTPPGGGVKFEELLTECVKREFLQETNLRVGVGDLLHVNELVTSGFHAVECYFEVYKTGGTLRLGHDPELSDDNQLLEDVKWIPLDSLTKVNFVPQSLVKLLQDWQNRSSFSIYS